MLPEMHYDIGLLINAKLDPRAVHEAEWSKTFWQFVRHDQEAILHAPSNVHKRIIVAPSNSGKSQIVDHLSYTSSNDPDFHQALQTVTGNADHRFLTFRLSLGEILEDVTDEQGKRKTDATEADRQEVSRRINKGIRILDNTFSDSPDYTTEVFVEVVGVTESDLGRSVVEQGFRTPDTTIIIPKPHPLIEDVGRDIRSRPPEDDSDLSAFAKTRGVIFDNQTNSRKHLERIAGLEPAWVRQWMDFRNQMMRYHFVHGNSQFAELFKDPEKFLATENQMLRLTAYWNWLPGRLRELAGDISEDEFEKTVVFRDNEFIEGGIHFHVEKLAVKGHVPAHILRSDKEAYEPDEILELMPGIVEGIEAEDIIIDFSESSPLTDSV